MLVLGARRLRVGSECSVRATARAAAATAACRQRGRAGAPISWHDQQVVPFKRGAGGREDEPAGRVVQVRARRPRRPVQLDERAVAGRHALRAGVAHGARGVLATPVPREPHPPVGAERHPELPVHSACTRAQHRHVRRRPGHAADRHGAAANRRAGVGARRGAVAGTALRVGAGQGACVRRSRDGCTCVRGR